MYLIGIPKEIKEHEHRVGMTPHGVQSLVAEGVSVAVETDAGLESGFTDHDYCEAGAVILSTAEELYLNSKIIKKVKEPQLPECEFLQSHHILFSFLHLSSPANAALVKRLLDIKLTAIGYETVEKGGKAPLLAPMSEIAGGLAASYAALLSKWQRERPGAFHRPADFLSQIKMIAGVYPSVPDLSLGKTIIWGGGVAGQKAAEMALSMNAPVIVVENDSRKSHDLLKKWKSHSLMTIYSPESLSENEMHQADVFIGCVHKPGFRAARLFNSETLKTVSEKKNKAIIDVAVDQGGNFPETRPTTYSDPFYQDSYGNIRFCVANIPSFCGKAASIALETASLNYTSSLARNYSGTLTLYPEIARAINVSQGKIMHPAVKEAQG